MLEVSSHNVWTAFAVTLAAGLATGLGSLMVVFSKKPNRGSAGIREKNSRIGSNTMIQRGNVPRRQAVRRLQT